jgi:hypothetical protein
MDKEANKIFGKAAELSTDLRRAAFVIALERIQEVMKEKARLNESCRAGRLSEGGDASGDCLCASTHFCGELCLKRCSLD